MGTTADGTPSMHAASVEDRHDLELLRDRYYVGLEGALFASVVVVGVVVAAFWNQSNRLGLVSWSAAAVLMTVPVLVLKRRRAELSFPHWLRWAYVIEVVQGLLWGGLAVGAMPSTVVGQAVVVSILLAVLMAGSVSSSQFTAAFVCFTVPLVALTVLGILLHGAEGIEPMIWVVLASWAFGASLATDQRATQLELVGALGANDRLVADLESGHDDLRSANTALARAKRRADVMARTDQLTGLPNRHAFSEQIETTLSSLGAGRHQNVTLAFFDLDGFKGVNDRFGHRAGDVLLAAVSARLRPAVRDTECVARIGGDEMVLLATDGNGEEIGVRLAGLFADPFAVAGERIMASASIGVATVTTQVTASELMARADAAQYTAKYAGGGRHVVWSAEASGHLDGEPIDDRHTGPRDIDARELSRNPAGNPA